MPARMSSAAIVTPTPIPAFAPELNPEDGDAVEEALLLADDGRVDVDWDGVVEGPEDVDLDTPDERGEDVAEGAETVAP